MHPRSHKPNCVSDTHAKPLTAHGILPTAQDPELAGGASTGPGTGDAESIGAAEDALGPATTGAVTYEVMVEVAVISPV
jgi:hypothetical protein